MLGANKNDQLSSQMLHKSALIFHREIFHGFSSIVACPRPLNHPIQYVCCWSKFDTPKLMPTSFFPATPPLHPTRWCSTRLDMLYHLAPPTHLHCWCKMTPQHLHALPMQLDGSWLLCWDPFNPAPHQPQPAGGLRQLPHPPIDHPLTPNHLLPHSPHFHCRAGTAVIDCFLGGPSYQPCDFAVNLITCQWPLQLLTENCSLELTHSLELSALGLIVFVLLENMKHNQQSVTLGSWFLHPWFICWEPSVTSQWQC